MRGERFLDSSVLLCKTLLLWELSMNGSCQGLLNSKGSATTARERDGLGHGIEQEPTASFDGLMELN